VGFVTLAIRSPKRRPRKAQSDARDIRLIVQTISPEAYADPELLSREISHWLLAHFKQFLMREAQRLPLPVSAYTQLAELSPAEFGDYILKVASGDSEANREVIHELSEFVFVQARTTIGWRLDLSPHVSALKRIWERQNPKMFAKYGEACETGARVAQRQQFPALDLRAEHELKEAAVPEMDALREKLRLAFPDSQGTSAAELLVRIGEMVSTGDAYPVLRWCSERAKEYGPLYTKETVKQLLMPKPPSSSDLWDGWRARQTGHSEPRIHKIISSGNFPQANP
jgi:hypothetical protein